MHSSIVNGHLYDLVNKHQNEDKNISSLKYYSFIAPKHHQYNYNSSCYPKSNSITIYHYHDPCPCLDLDRGPRLDPCYEIVLDIDLT